MVQGELTEAGKHIELGKSNLQGETRQVRALRAKIFTLASRLAAARGDAGIAVNDADAAAQVAAAKDFESDVFLQSEVAITRGAALYISAPSTDGLRWAAKALSGRSTAQSANSALLAEAEILTAVCASALGQTGRAEGLMTAAQLRLRSQQALGPQFQREWVDAMAKIRRKSVNSG
jgi:hypothetical protein